MTSKQLARRLGVVQSRVLAMEKAETSGALTLLSLERAAQALDCRLVYILVPRKPLEGLVQERAAALARQRLAAASHSMRLEAQGVDAEDERKQFETLVQDLATQSGSTLWDAL